MTKQPTKKQTALLKFIEEFTEQNNYSPSYREIQRALNLNSVSAVAEHINNCEKAGFLEKIPEKARSLRVIHADEHPEAAELFRAKQSELRQKLAQLSPDAPEKSQILDDLSTLESAAHLLHIRLR